MDILLLEEVECGFKARGVRPGIAADRGANTTPLTENDELLARRVNVDELQHIVLVVTRLNVRLKTSSKRRISKSAEVAKVYSGEDNVISGIRIAVDLTLRAK